MSFGFWVLGSGFRISGLGFRVVGLRTGFQGSALGVQGPGSGFSQGSVKVLGYGSEASGFRAFDFVLRVMFCG